ncbi:uncharacterized protein LOC133723064 [Rosa rugosa]|uniref:uncharacterized protein LOC133723064 n=1 Tax=Rosa rugosa TaxID=74645 RepID=UPI002B40D40D|nr:uncharacterized protein LOC133723064 [Rosa rugosa]
MDQNALFDLKFRGPKFTWENKREDSGEVVRERLDRVIGNAVWLSSWPDSITHHEPRIGSDHCPLVLYTHPRVKIGPKLFRFEATWADDPECEEIINTNWSSNPNTNPFSLWGSNLLACKRSLLQWSKRKYPNNRAVINALNWELGEIQSGEFSPVARTREKEIVAELETTWKLEESFWRQSSRINWLLEGDRNTRFFHLSTLHRRQRNRINSMCIESDIWISEEGQIREAFTSFFGNLYSSSGPRNWGNTLNSVVPQISSEQNSKLTRPFLLEEIHTATKQLEHQNAFIPGRQIQDNLILAYEAYHYLKLKNSKSDHELALKLDMNKAYDRVEWDFLEAPLLKFGFDSKWATTANCQTLCSIIDTYCVALGQSVNYEKSSIFFSANTPPKAQYEIAVVLNIAISNEPGTYLGLPTHWGNSKKKALTYIRDRIKQKLDGWNANVLSQVGREILIKAVAMVVINSDIANFWWGSNGNKGTIHWKAWDSLCKSKSEGV